MRIEAGVQFLFAKPLICKGVSILFNDNRLYGNRGMVAVEPVCFFAYELFNEWIESSKWFVSISSVIPSFS